MIISRGRRYIFVHIPKTGGTAMTLALEARAMADDILISDTPKAMKRKRRLNEVKTAGRLWKHSTLADIDGLLGPEDLPDFTVFTLVRNPWDRMVSYYHWLKDQSFEHPAVTRAKALDFEAFVLDPLVTQSIKASPARRYVTDAAGTAQPCHFVRLEHFEADIEPVEAHLGFKLDLEPTNRSSRERDFRIYYTDKTASRLADMAAEDIERFGYSFED